MSRFQSALLILLGVWLLSVGGCGRPANPDLHAVKGEVSLDDDPLLEGNIVFFPDGPGSVASGTTIRDGQFSIPQAKGLKLGKYKVSITATAVDVDSLLDTSSDPDENPPNVISLIPPIYNSETVLSVEIEADSDNFFKFELKTN